MGLSSLLLVERQRLDQEERERAARLEASRLPRLPDGFNRDEARRAIIAALGKARMPGQLYVALQNGLPSLSDAAMFELYQEVTEEFRERRLGDPVGEAEEPKVAAPPAPVESKPEQTPEAQPSVEAKDEPAKEPEAPADAPSADEAKGTKKDGRRGR